MLHQEEEEQETRVHALGAQEASGGGTSRCHSDLAAAVDRVRLSPEAKCPTQRPLEAGGANP